MKKEIKSLPFEIKSTEDSGDYFIFEGYASTFGNVDLGNDIIARGAFANSLAKSAEVPVLWQHQMSEPVGKSTNLYEDDKGLYIKAILPKADTLVSGRIIPQMKVGSIREMSIGFFTKDSEFEKNVRILKEIDLFEVSLVTKAMNPQALVSGFKTFSANTKLPLATRDMAWDGTAAEKRVRDFTNSQDAPSEDYRKYFMWFDGAAPELFGSYKLQFVDIVDGEPHIVPRAVFAIAGILNGARGGVDISEADQNRAATAVNQLYKRMASEFNDETIVSPVAKSFNSLKEIEASLKLAGYSNTEAKMMISKIKEFSNHQRKADENAQREVAILTQIDELKRQVELINLTNRIRNGKF
jgi:HK97 family phage prohead protease